MYNKQAFKNHCNPQHMHSFKRFGEGFHRGDWKASIMQNFSYPPANVQEKDDSYELHLFAPGYEKSDFLIAVIDKKLSVSIEKEKVEKGENWKRLEFIPKGFVRQFELNEKIDKSLIKAKYENGVLILKLPKMEGFETSREEIKVE